MGGQRSSTVSRIRGLVDREELFVLSSTGRVLEHVVGGERDVGPNVDTSNATIVHNHPPIDEAEFPPSFSVADVSTAIRGGVAKIQVLSNPYDYTMTFAPSVRGDVRFRDRVLLRVAELRTEIHERLSSEGDRRYVGARREHFVWNQIAREFPEIRYSRRDNGRST